MPNATDLRHLQDALSLARQGLNTTAPNPRVGSVIVRDGRVIGRGYHAKAGEPHAEILALRDAGDARGATVYVTLEPCSHHGRTPPCSDALIRAGVARVVVAMQDPNPKVAGQGLARLRDAGIEVQCGLLETEARALNPGFIKRMQQGLPWLRLKLAMSLDGRTAMASGESQWITGEAARADVQQLRARSCAILTGIGTALADDPALTVRLAGTERQPLRVVVDSRLRLPPTAKLLQQPGATLVVTASDNTERRAALEQAGAEVAVLPGPARQVDLRATLQLLAERHCNEVMVEAGSALGGALWQAGLVDALTVYMAPTLLGSAAQPLLELPFARMAQQQRLLIDAITAVGDDWRIDARPQPGQPPHRPEGQR